MQIDQLLSRFKSVQQTGNGNWMALCPAHEDRKPSLSIGLKDNKILLHCHAGCDTEAVAQAVGLKISDLFLDSSVSSRIVKSYSYKDENGKLLYQSCRTEPKGFFQQRPDGKGGWINNLKDTRRVLYRLPELLNDRNATVFVVEGEKDADRLASLGLVATCNSGGAGKWRDEYAAVLQGRDVVILPDNDQPGYKHGEKVAASLHNVAASVKIVQLPELLDGGDVSDWLDAGHTVKKLQALVHSTAVFVPEPLPSADTTGKGLTCVQRLMEFMEGVELFHTFDKRTFTKVPDGNKYRILSVEQRGGGFRSWLIKRYMDCNDKPPNTTAVGEVMAGACAQATEGPEYEVYVRLAAKDDRIYLDLGGKTLDAIEISPSGYRVVKNPPVLFWRSEGLAELPVPKGGIDGLAKIEGLLNLNDRRKLFLCVAWLVGCLQPGAPYSLLLLLGEAGSAKSTTCRVLRFLIDPAGRDGRALIAPPRVDRDLFAVVKARHILAIDNLSRIPAWLSDLLSSIATGGGQATRKLYSDSDLACVDAQRPILLNGIEVIGLGADLMDRAIVLTLDKPQKRKVESAYWQEVEEARPYILGGLCTAISCALRNRGAVTIDNDVIPRMADFAFWVKAAEEALHEVKAFKGLDFLDIYAVNRKRVGEEILEASVIGPALISVAESEWKGTATELLKKLTIETPERVELKGWPKTPESLGRMLMRLASALCEAGFEYEKTRAKHGVIYHIKKTRP